MKTIIFWNLWFNPWKRLDLFLFCHVVKDNKKSEQENWMQHRNRAEVRARGSNSFDTKRSGGAVFCSQQNSKKITTRKMLNNYQKSWWQITIELAPENIICHLSKAVTIFVTNFLGCKYVIGNSVATFFIL